jgi:hypothetical protein
LIDYDKAACGHYTSDKSAILTQHTDGKAKDKECG